MTEIRFSLVGPGNVGESLARWLTATGARLDAIGARRPDAAEALASETGATRVDLGELDSSASDLLLLCVSDSALEEVALTLSERPQAGVALHVAGACDAEVLAPLRNSASALGTFHPLRAFPQPSHDPQDARGQVFTLDGDPRAVTLARTLATRLDAVPIEIDPAARPLYHLGATLAAGGVVTVQAVAHRISRELGLPAAVADAYIALSLQALDRARAAADPAAALTGPVARGEVDLVERQLAELGRVAPELLEFVRALGRETLRQRRSTGTTLAGDQRLARLLGAEPDTELGAERGDFS